MAGMPQGAPTQAGMAKHLRKSSGVRLGTRGSSLLAPVVRGSEAGGARPSKGRAVGQQDRRQSAIDREPQMGFALPVTRSSKAAKPGFRLALPDQNKKGGSRVSGLHWQQASRTIEAKAGRASQGAQGGGAHKVPTAGRYQELAANQGLAHTQSESELRTGRQLARGESPAAEELADGKAEPTRLSLPKVKDQLKKGKQEAGKPFSFLSSLGNSQADAHGFLGHDPEGGLLLREPALGLASRQHAALEEESLKNAKSQVKIFTQLDVTKPIHAPSRLPPAALLSGYVVEEMGLLDEKGQDTGREAKEFQITTQTMGRQRRAVSSATGNGSRLSRRGGASSRAAVEGLPRTKLPGGLAASSLEDHEATPSAFRGGEAGPEVLPRRDGQAPTEGDLDGDDLSAALARSFGEKIMATKPTTAFLKEADNKLPYPPLFDRSERTFAATFAKFGDLSYFTPVQRIGVYMDFSQRLQKRHLTDLIAYLKTAKHPIKALDEDYARSEAGMQEYLENCLFHGAMTLEEAPANPFEVDKGEEDVAALAHVYDFPPPPLADQGAFQYDAVWSGQLLKQVEHSTLRFRNYLDSPDSIRNEEVAKFRKEWMQHALDFIPDFLLQTYSEHVKVVFQEVFASYVRAMKQAILEYILRSPDERKRLHILMLPQPRMAASQRHAKTGGYSVVTYPGVHQRKLEADGKIKMGLITYNIASSSLENWWQDFSHFDLLQLRNLGQFIVEKDPGKPGSALYALEIDQFFRFQEAYRLKVLGVLRNVWHRGCMLIIKKFKWLRTPGPERVAERGMGAKGKWTFRGYKPGQLETNERRWVDDAAWRAIYAFKYDNKMTPLQAYYMRAAAVHQNVHLHYFLNEEGQECTDVMSASDWQEDVGLRQLPDIRDCSAYRSYIGIIGGDLDLSTNGYEELSKEQRRELKFAAGNMMQY